MIRCFSGLQSSSPMNGSRPRLPGRLSSRAIRSYMFSPIAEHAVGPLALEARHEQRQRADEVRRELYEDRALEQRLAHQAEVEVLQVAQAAVDELRRPARGARREVLALDQGDAVAARRRVERDAGAGDPAPDDDEVVFVLGERLERVLAADHGRYVTNSWGSGRAGRRLLLALRAQVDQARGSARHRPGRPPRSPPRCAGRRACASSSRARARAPRAARCRWRTLPSSMSSSSCSASPVCTTLATTSVGARSSLRPLGARRTPSAARAPPARARGSATAPSGGGWAPSGRARTARRGSRDRPARRHRPCACGGSGSPRRAPRRRNGYRPGTPCGHAHTRRPHLARPIPHRRRLHRQPEDHGPGLDRQAGEAARAHRLLSRAVGARDLTLGAGGLQAAVRNDGSAQQWLAAAAICDAVDFGATYTAGRAIPRSARTSVLVIAAAGALLSAIAAAGTGKRATRSRSRRPRLHRGRRRPERASRHRLALRDAVSLVDLGLARELDPCVGQYGISSRRMPRTARANPRSR